MTVVDIKTEYGIIHTSIFLVFDTDAIFRTAVTEGHILTQNCIEKKTNRTLWLSENTLFLYKKTKQTTVRTVQEGITVTITVARYCLVVYEYLLITLHDVRCSGFTL